MLDSPLDLFFYLSKAEKEENVLPLLSLGILTSLKVTYFGSSRFIHICGNVDY